MSEEQLSALLAKVKSDDSLREKLLGAADPGAAVRIAEDAGFDVRMADWLRYQAKRALELSDADLEVMTGGFFGSLPNWSYLDGCIPTHLHEEDLEVPYC